MGIYWFNWKYWNHKIRRTTRDSMSCNLKTHTEKYFLKLVKTNQIRILISTKWNLVWCQINRKTVITAQIWLNWEQIWARLLLQPWYTEKTILPIPFPLNGIWSWEQFSFRFWIKWNSIWFKIERKTVTTIISHPMWKEMDT